MLSTSLALLLLHSASATQSQPFTVTTTTIAVVGLLFTALTLLISSFIRMRSNGRKDGIMEQEHKYMQQQIEILMKSESVVNYATVQIQVNGLLKEVDRINQAHNECNKRQSERSKEIFDLLRGIEKDISTIKENQHGNRENSHR